MARRGAPMALRMPISRVRSVTVTSMMFMIPMPPTSRLMAATAPSSTVKVSLLAALCEMQGALVDDGEGEVGDAGLVGRGQDVGRLLLGGVDGVRSSWPGRSPR